jgi:hypothetical protein
VIDVFTHRGMFAVKFLWPVSSVHFDGMRWETPWFLAVNFAALAVETRRVQLKPKETADV